MKKNLLALLAITSSMFAQNSSYELSLLTSGTKTLNTDIQKQLSFGLGIAKNFENTFLNQAELSLLKTVKSEYSQSSTNAQITRISLNAVKNLKNFDNSSIYALVGLGHENIKNELNSYESGAYANYGIGYKYKVNDYGILKADIRHMLKLSGEKDNVSLVLGIGIPFGKKISQAPKKIKTLAVKKTKKVIAPKIPIKINNDIDNDGIENHLDQCKNTPTNAKVDKIGCIVSVNLEINFDYKSSEVNKKYLNSLNNFALFLKDNPKYKVVIKAYTDSIGSDKYNLELSQQRANSTIKELIKLNIDESRLSSEGYGESNPIASNSTEEGRATNRRVTAVIVK